MEKLKSVRLLLCFFCFPCIFYSFTFSDSSYYPMSIGNEWQYNSEFNPHSETITDILFKNGNLYYGISRFMSEPEYWLREHNNRIYCLNVSDSTEFLLFDFTIDIGDSIILPAGYECSFGNKIFLVSNNDTIITSYGTFYNCYHFSHRIFCNDAGIHDTWFSKGIGKVKYIAEYIYGVVEFSLSDYSIITSIGNDEQNEIISYYNLLQNYPNPFNPTTTIEYAVPNVETLHTAFVQIKIYDILGREIATLLNQFQKPGNYKIEFNASNLPSGIYLYQIKAGNFVEAKKMILMK